MDLSLDEAKQLLTRPHEKFAGDIRLELQQGGVENDSNDGLQTLLDNPNAFHDGFEAVKDECRQERFFKDHFGLVEPAEY